MEIAAAAKVSVIASIGGAQKATMAFISCMLELLLFLLFTRAQPLLIEVDILHLNPVPSDEVEVRQQVDHEANEFVRPANDSTATACNRLVHWLTT